MAIAGRPSADDHDQDAANSFPPARTFGAPDVLKPAAVPMPAPEPSYPTDPIHLLCAADARYGGYAGIMLASVLRANPGESFDIHLLSDGMRAGDRRKLSALVARAGSRLSVYDVAARLTGYSDGVGNHLSRAAYARLLIADLLPAALSRILYLDCDIICTGALRPLWHLAETTPLLGAVPDRTGERWKARLGLPAEAAYFNSGVLLINLAAWRERDIAGQIIAWMNGNPDKLALADQDAINACLWAEITPLPDCWNLQIGLDSGPLPAARLNDAVLLHYTSAHKPWRFRFRGLGAEIFLSHKRQSPWRFKPPTFRFVYRLNKSLNKRLARWRAPPTTQPTISANRRAKASGP
jgi:lipopolysaccharide biosynthesis glycosyltransferase